MKKKMLIMKSYLEIKSDLNRSETFRYFYYLLTINISHS